MSFDKSWDLEGLGPDPDVRKLAGVMSVMCMEMMEQFGIDSGLEMRLGFDYASSGVTRKQFLHEWAEHFKHLIRAQTERMTLSDVAVFDDGMTEN